MIRSTWGLPVLLALASLTGLVVALTGDGARDGAAWLLLALPIVAVVWAMRVQRR